MPEGDEIWYFLSEESISCGALSKSIKTVSESALTDDSLSEFLIFIRCSFFSRIKGPTATKNGLIQDSEDRKETVPSSVSSLLPANINHQIGH